MIDQSNVNLKTVLSNFYLTEMKGKMKIKIKVKNISRDTQKGDKNKKLRLFNDLDIIQSKISLILGRILV